MTRPTKAQFDNIVRTSNKNYYNVVTLLLASDKLRCYECGQSITGRYAKPVPGCECEDLRNVVLRITKEGDD